MSREILFISDTHFFHTNLLKFTRKDGTKIRPFSSINEMHEIMIEKWNKKVRPQDKVYHLGDVTFKYNHEFTELMFRLNGHKRLIVGNHDEIKNPTLLYPFEKVYMWRIFKEHNFVASHVS